MSMPTSDLLGVALGRALGGGISQTLESAVLNKAFEAPDPFRVIQASPYLAPEQKQQLFGQLAFQQEQEQKAAAAEKKAVSDQLFAQAIGEYNQTGQIDPQLIQGMEHSAIKELANIISKDRIAQLKEEGAERRAIRSEEGAERRSIRTELGRQARHFDELASRKEIFEATEAGRNARSEASLALQKERLSFDQEAKLAKTEQEKREALAAAEAISQIQIGETPSPELLGQLGFRGLSVATAAMGAAAVGEKRGQQLAAERSNDQASKILTAGEKAESDLSIISEMESLTNLTSNGRLIASQLLEKIPVIGSFLRDPSAAQIQQLAIELSAGAAKAAVGAAQITQREFMWVLNKFPQATDSIETQRALLRMLRLDAETKTALADAANEILEANKGVAPSDISQQSKKLAESRINQAIANYRRSQYTAILNSVKAQPEKGWVRAIDLSTGEIIELPKEDIPLVPRSQYYVEGT